MLASIFMKPVGIKLSFIIDIQREIEYFPGEHVILARNFIYIILIVPLVAVAGYATRFEELDKLL
jgi:hypothetical protein